MNYLEIRLIGTSEQLDRAVAHIGLIYDIHSESKLYSCRNEPEKKRLYITASAKNEEEVTK